MKKTLDKKERGKKARQTGGIFERRVRADLESKGWIVTKWQNQVDFEKDKLIPAPDKFNFFTKTRTQSQGFPDFLAYRDVLGIWEIMGVESKSAKYLDKDEKAKCQWLLKHHVFDQVIVGYKDKQGHIEYYEVEEDDLECQKKQL